MRIIKCYTLPIMVKRPNIDCNVLYFTGMDLDKAMFWGWNGHKLTWTDKQAWIHPDQSKAEEPIGVPLHHGAMSVLENKIGRYNRFVFVRYGKKLNGIDGINPV